MKLLLITLAFIAFNGVSSVNKYSKDANVEKASLKDLDKPFRMQKLNLLWAKAKVVSKKIIFSICIEISFSFSGCLNQN